MIALGCFHHLSGQAEDQPLKMRVPMKGRGVLERGVEHIHLSKVMDSLRDRQGDRLASVGEF